MTETTPEATAQRHNPWSFRCGRRVDGEPYRDGDAVRRFLSYGPEPAGPGPRQIAERLLPLCKLYLSGGKERLEFEVGQFCEALGLTPNEAGRIIAAARGSAGSAATPETTRRA